MASAHLHLKLDNVPQLCQKLPAASSMSVQVPRASVYSFCFNRSRQSEFSIVCFQQRLASCLGRPQNVVQASFKNRSKIGVIFRYVIVGATEPQQSNGIPASPQSLDNGSNNGDNGTMG